MKQRSRNLDKGQSAPSCNQEESDALLQETREATELEIEIVGITDLRPLLAAVQMGRVLHPIHLAAVAATVDAAQSLQDCLGEAQVGWVLSAFVWENSLEERGPRPVLLAG